MIRVGTSGYNYPEWRGTFYPADLKTAAMFDHYASRFRTVEINYTFRRMPTPKVTTAWADQAPAGFTYALKAPQQMTHVRRLKDCEDPLRTFCENARLLGSHLGPLLFQLPPTFRRDPERLGAFLALVPPDIRTAFEFRHDSWLADDVYALLAAHHAALCIADFGDRTTPVERTARHGYLRLRDEGYGPEDLARWAGVVVEQAAHWDETWVFFKHEEEGKGPEFARAFLDALNARDRSRS
jgi:uncharacterized protein YecE (DUF72 family)